MLRPVICPEAGMRFARLTSMGEMLPHENQKRVNKIKCICDCGKIVWVRYHSLFRSTAKSCGCLRRDLHATQNGMSRLPEYQAHRNMIQRCTNPASSRWKNYGDRGVCVCTEWLESFTAFFNDMGAKPTAEHTLERVNVNLGYCKENCVWLHKSLQNKNTTRTIFKTYDGKSLCLADWAREVGIKRATIVSRLAAGWSFEKAIKKTPQSRPKRPPSEHLDQPIF